MKKCLDCKVVKPVVMEPMPLKAAALSPWCLKSQTTWLPIRPPLCYSPQAVWPMAVDWRPH